MSEISSGNVSNGYNSFDTAQNAPVNLYYDDDGRPKRTGTVWTACAHIITAVIGSEVLALAWAVAQLGWIAGPTALLLFSLVTYYTSTLLAACYRTGHPDNGTRNYTYMDAVRANFGGWKVQLCRAIKCVNLFGVVISYTITGSISMAAIQRSNCFQTKGDKNPCRVSSKPYMIAFGVVEIILSQIPGFDKMWWLPIVSAVMSFTFSAIGVGLGIAKVAENGKIKGNWTRISVGTITGNQKIWRSFQAIGAIAFAYSYSLILIEIQDTIKSPPSEYKTMKKVNLISFVVTTILYVLCGCFGYAAFGDLSPDNLLSGFGFYNPYWLLDVANAALAIRLICSYQVYCQPLFAKLEKTAAEYFPGLHTNLLKINLFRLVCRTSFVIVVTVISMLFPFFKDVVGVLGAVCFWPLTVYFPMEMYIAQKRIEKWSKRWIGLKILSVACFVVSLVAAVGSVVEVVSDLKVYGPFSY